MYQIQLWNDLSDKGLKRFTDDYHVQRETEQPDAFLVRSKDLHDMRFPDSLKAVARAGVGVNTIPLDQLANRGIPVFSTPGANANAVKELVIGSLFLTARKLVPSLLWTNNLRGPDIPERIEANKKQFVGTELLGKRIGIVGLGAIGANLANTLHELGMTVTGYDPHMSVESAWRVSNQIQRATQLEDLLATSDYITLHLPLVDATTGLLDASLFSKMKHGATLLNFSRGELVDEQALAEVLRSGRLANYVTDFPNAFILSLPGSLLYHISGHQRVKRRKTVPSWRSINCVCSLRQETSAMRSISQPSSYRSLENDELRLLTTTFRTWSVKSPRC